MIYDSVFDPLLTPLCPSVKNPIDASVLLTEASLARKQRKSHATFIPLMVSEMPQAGELVGLDAEFVTLNQVRSQGDIIDHISVIRAGEGAARHPEPGEEPGTK